MKVFVDQDRCVASGQCALTAADVFDQDEYGVAVLRNDNPPDDRMDVRDAEAGCPALAITIDG